MQAEILDLLRTCRDEFGATIVLITHNMGVVADLADRVIVMYRGDIVEQAPVRELFAAPREEYTRDLLAAVPHVAAARAPTRRSTPPPPPLRRRVATSWPRRSRSDTPVASAPPAWSR